MARTKLPKGGLAALQELCRHGELTRRELQGLLEVSGPTITRVVSHLDELGLISAAVIGEGSLGRPAAAISLNPQGLGVIAVSLNSTGTTMVLASIGGTPIKDVTVDVSADVEYETAVERLSEAARGLFSSARTTFRAIAGIGISFGGAASFDEGRLTTPSGFPTWHGRALAADVRERTGLPTFIDNQPVGHIRAMRWYNDQEMDNRYLCFADWGIAGCSSTGDPRRDRGVSTGGFGHMGGRLIGERPCWCGLYDCLNTRASLRGLHSWAVRDGLVPEDLPMSEIVGALEADSRGREALENAARELVFAGIDACRVLGIQGYILAGSLFDSSEVARSTAAQFLEDNKRLVAGSFLPPNLAQRGAMLSAIAIAADGMALEGRIETMPAHTD
ncbi:MAG: ROK family protein [Ancrocorticia sp.]